MKRILLAEDEEAIREFVFINLKRVGYEVTEVTNGLAAIEEFDKALGLNPTPATGNETQVLFAEPFDVVLLDIMMPGASGLEVCRHIRQKSQTTGIIMLSAKTQEMDKVNALQQGADDYITKPFSTTELIARVDAIHRRVTLTSHLDVNTDGNDNNLLLFSGEFVLDEKTCFVTKKGKNINLSQTEYNLLEFLVKSEGRPLTREELRFNIWGEGNTVDDKIIDVNIRRLRLKIENDPSSPEYLKSVRSVGYVWQVPKKPL